MTTPLKNLVLAIIALIASTTPCLAQNMSLKYMSDKMNVKCPVEITDRSKLVSTECIGNEIVFNIELKEPDFNMDQLIENNEYWKTLLRDEYIKSGEGTRQMLSLISNSGAAFKMVCVGSQTGKKASCAFTPEETKSILSANGAAPMEFFTLENLIVIINSAAPFPLLDGIFITSASKSDDNIIIENSLDDAIIDIDDLIRNANQLKNNILNNLPYNEGVRFLANLCVKKEANLILRFSGTQSEKVFYTVLTSKDMEKALKRERK